MPRKQVKRDHRPEAKENEYTLTREVCFYDTPRLPRVELGTLAPGIVFIDEVYGVWKKVESAGWVHSCHLLKR